MRRTRRLGSETLGKGFTATRTVYAPGTVLEDHHHAGAALSIPFAGAFVETFGRREYRVDTRSVLYKKPEFAHRNVVGREGFDGVLVELDRARHGWLVDAVGRIGDNERIGDPGVRPLVRAFATAWDSELPARALLLESLAAQLLARFGRVARAEPRRPAWLSVVVEALRETFPRRPTLAALAGLVGVHPVHLAQTFKQHEGCSVGAYVERLRIAAVCDALRAGHDGLASIASNTGFADQSHMPRAFPRATGTTPARYRRRS